MSTERDFKEGDKISFRGMHGIVYKISGEGANIFVRIEGWAGGHGGNGYGSVNTGAKDGYWVFPFLLKLIDDDSFLGNF